MKTEAIINFTSNVHHSREKGYSLVSTALFVVGLGIMMAAGVMVYDQWRHREALVTTSDRIAFLENAMRGYLALHGRYPCPASLTALPDSPQFGIEMKSAADPDKCTGHFGATGVSGRQIWTGAVPTRSLNIPDEWAMDGWDHRFAYAVTELYTGSNPPLTSNQSAIQVIDANGNNATSSDGNVTYAFLTMGDDTHGAYSFNGTLIQTCDAALASGANCAFEDGTHGGVFTNSVARVYKLGSTKFTHTVDYRTVPISQCTEKGAAKSPKNIAYLVDTSGSMALDGGCPPSLGPRCSRIDVARWALRRVVPVRLLQNADQDNNDPNHPPQTLMTGFVVNSNIQGDGTLHESDVNTHLGDISVPDEKTALNNISTLCPSGNTPLGIHVKALADKIQDGTPDRPNVIMVISDGLSNVGDNPIGVANYIHTTYPNLRVNIIDVSGNPDLQQVATITGGAYSLSLTGDGILDTMLNLSGVCGDFTPPTHPVDTPGCGSSGGWWNK